MHRHSHHSSIRREERNEGNDLMPKEVIDAVQRIVAVGKEAIVKKERGKWVVLENGKRLVYKEP
jgi:hypothetical protein